MDNKDTVTVGNFGKTMSAQQLLLSLKETDIGESEILVVSWIDKKTSVVNTAWVATSNLTLMGLLEVTKLHVIEHSTYEKT